MREIQVASRDQCSELRPFHIEWLAIPPFLKRYACVARAFVMYDREHVAQSLGDEVMPGPYLEPCQVAQCSTHTLEADTVCWSNQLFHGSKMVTAFPAAVHGSIQVRTLEPIRAQTTVRHPCNFMPRSFEIAKITPVAASVIGRATYTAKPIRVDFHERCGVQH